MDRAADVARSMWDSVREGTQHFEKWEAPPPGHRVRQFFHGLALPLHLMRALWSDPVARRQYLRVGAFQALAVILLSIPLLPSRGNDGEPSKGHAFTLHLGDEDEDDTEQAADAEGEAQVHQAQAEADRQQQEQEQEQGPIERLLGRIDREVKFWVTVFGIMQLVQWVVIALSRQYHDALSRQASLLTALKPEDGPLTPRVQLDVPWMRKKLSRRIRAFMVFLSGMPVLYALTAVFPFRHQLLAVLIPAWSAYWLVVFTTARSAYAWNEAAPRAPWFLRGWTWLTTRVPGFRWNFLQRYGAFWTRRTEGVFSPAAAAEQQPWAFAGLTVVGMLSMLPLAKCFLRPLIPVAAGHLLVARQQAERAAAPKHLQPPAQPPAASSSAA